MAHGLRALLLLGLLLALPAAAWQFFSDRTANAQPVVFPPEARETLHLIEQGGPFPFPRDGVVFGNYEHRLPEKPRSYYHEYTVKTPGERGRGARRIVCGQQHDCYYSGDHYQTFQPFETRP